MDAPGARGEPLPSRELAAFLAAVDAGGIGAAAVSLSLTQSAVTKRIQSLERRLGTALLQRSHNGVRPTEAGQPFIRTLEMCSLCSRELRLPSTVSTLPANIG
jgi:DNA-binding transcriptional LysR family regulator